MINIISNGSKWAGESEDTLDKLCEVLTQEPLDRTFEDFGNFILAPDQEGPTRFWGNFYNLSHVFSIETDEPETIARLTDLIRSNQQTDAYLAQLDPREKKRIEDLRYTAWQIARREHRDGIDGNRRVIRTARGYLYVDAASEQDLRAFVGLDVADATAPDPTKDAALADALTKELQFGRSSVGSVGGPLFDAQMSLIEGVK